MITTPRPVCAPVAWPAAARALGIEDRGAAYPRRAPCPLCTGGRLTIYQDNRSRGHWHHCDGCGSTGDMPALAAAAWGVPYETALGRLEAAGAAGPPVPASEAERWETVAGYWREASRRAWAEPPPRELSRLAARLKLAHGLDGRRAREGPARFMGWSSCQEAEAAFAPGSAALGRSLRPSGGLNNPSKVRLFREHGWGHVLAFPYGDVPGRVRGFAFVGRAGRDADVVHRRVGDLSPEFGLAGLDAALDDPGTLGGAVIAVPDVRLMARVQVRHLQTSTRPLPLVAWYEGPAGVTSDSWRALAGRDVVLWSTRLDPPTLRQAAALDARLWVAGPGGDGPALMDDWLYKQPAADLAARAVKRARHWPKAVERWAEGQAPGAVEALLRGLRDTDRYGLLGGVEARVAELLGRAAPAQMARTVSLARHEVTEHPDGSWTAAEPSRLRRPRRASTLVCDAALRIDRVVAGTPEAYQGWVRHRGRDVPFEELRDVVEADPVAFMDRLLIETGSGVLTADRSWAGRLTHIARLFHPPRAVRPGG